jgi:hypothetical protein
MLLATFIIYRKDTARVIKFNFLYIIYLFLISTDDDNHDRDNDDDYVTLILKHFGFVFETIKSVSSFRFQLNRISDTQFRHFIKIFLDRFM